jgi:ubiquinone/menaquinone biosynthesis C-methylase UbiE
LDQTLADHKDIYGSEAQKYQALVSREDYQGNLLPSILAIDPLHGKDVLELGAGTGRITCQVAPLVQKITASDVSHHMLRIGKICLTALGFNNWFLSLESHTALPFMSDSADVIIAGWSFCYAAIDAGENWQSGLEKALSEAGRVLRPGGKLILIESLGTGFESPHRPEVLRDYLDYLDKDGFASKRIRTDYRFKDFEEACDLTSFFFGDNPLSMWEGENGVIVPECTGLWWKDH